MSKDFESTRAFHSSARVAFVKTLPCIACRTTGAVRQNHHTRSGGKGRRSDYHNIVPLCHGCHERVHRAGPSSVRRFIFGKGNAVDWQNEAFRVELLWQLHRRWRFDTMKMVPLPDVLTSFLDDAGCDVAIERLDGHVLVHVAECRPEVKAWPSLPSDDMDTIDWLDAYRTFQNTIMATALTDIEHPFAGTTSVFNYAPAASEFVQRLAADNLLRVPTIPLLTEEPTNA
jgi:hypothetical protein